MKTLLFIVNPKAGRTRSLAPMFDVVVRFSEAGYLVKVVTTADAGDARRAASQLGGQFDLVVCAGGDGTLNYNMKGYPESLRKRIRVKSGSMNGVRCYSGYVIPAELASQLETNKGRICDVPQEVKDQIIIFSILTNNCTSPQWKVRPMLDKFMADIAR